jgi:arylsulfatase A-like enzyme
MLKNTINLSRQARDKRWKMLEEKAVHAGLWENTVVTFASDNGGPLDHTTNYPLRGGKHTFWDGGVRVVGFISGG